MQSNRWVLWGTLLLALTPGAVPAAGWFSGGSGTGWAVWRPGPAGYTQQHVPYFAQHPPVYYSHPVARPYGYLPYAYLPVAPPAPRAEAQPIVVLNCYTPQGAFHGSAGGTAPAARRIVNRFAQEPEAPAGVPDEVPLLEPEG